MPTLYIDFETTYGKGVSLQSMTLRQYLAHADVLGVAVAVDDGPVEWIPAGPELDASLAEFEKVAQDPAWTVVAHNAAFDIRVWRHKLGLSQPQKVHCTMELASAVWPNQPGGYKLGALAKSLYLGFDKLGDGTKVMKMTPAELAAYCINDVELCRAIHKLAIERIHPDELKIAELTNAVRELHFNVDQASIGTAIDEFQDIAGESIVEAIAALGEGGDDAFGLDGEGGAKGLEPDAVTGKRSTKVRSVKPAALKALLLSNLGFDTPSISFKKINPEKLKLNAAATQALKATSRANKALSQSRRVRVFTGSPEVDAELGYFRAHTGRFSSPSVGKGLNLHNLNKRDKKLAKAIRSVFRLPDGYCFVRADLANVEYRVEGWLTGCEHTKRLFEHNLFADPYSAFWKEATGQTVTKDDPARQVAKAAVLGLGYGMGLETWVRQLLLALADPEFKVTVKNLEDICAAQGWAPPNKKYALSVMTKTFAPWPVVSVAEHTRELFQQIHPEFGRVARWLQEACGRLVSARDQDHANRILDMMYDLPQAPRRDMIGLIWSPNFEGCTVRVVCGAWAAPTVTWRDIDVRMMPKGGACLSCIHGKKGYRPLIPSICIENVVQSAARNALCSGLLHMEARQHPYILHVHDEIMPVAGRDTVSVSEARRDLISVFGPNGVLAPNWGWSVVINPDEVNVSESLYEVDVGKLVEPSTTNAEWWNRLADGDATLLENLP